MAQTIIQPSFAAGEIAPNLYSRIDLAKYQVGAALLRNMFVDYRGGVSNRAGTAYIMRCINSNLQNRLIPFTFSTIQSYAIVFGHQTCRFIMNGGLVLDSASNGTTGPFAITNISAATPAVVTAPGHNFVNGDTIFIDDTGTALDGNFFLAAAVAANVYSLHDLDGNNVTETGWVSGGDSWRVYTLASPYNSTQLTQLKYTQSADTMTLTHPDETPRQLTRTNHAAWAFSTISFTSSIGAPGSVTVTPSAAGSLTYRYKVTAVTNHGLAEGTAGTGFTSSSDAMSVTPGVCESVAWSAVSGAEFYNIYRQRETIDVPPATGDLYGFVGQSTSLTFVDMNITPDFTRTPPKQYNPFSGTDNKPNCSTYFNSRQMFAGTNNLPQTIWGSKTGDFLNMDFSTPTRDDDSIEATLASQQVNAIQFMVPMNSLLAMTTGGAWKIDGGSISDSITPAAFNAVPQAYNGCSPTVPPIVANYDILYVQSKGAIVRDLSYSFYSNIYTGTDTTILSCHLFENHLIREWCYSEEPHKLIWAVRDDGVLLSLTFLKDQEVQAWTHSDTQGRFLSTCSIPELPEDAVYFIVERYVDGQSLQYIERLESRQIGAIPEYNVPADLDLCWFVDAGVRYPFTYLSATLRPAITDNNPTLPVAGTPVIGTVTVVDGGSGYTAPTITDLNGSGATFSVVLSGGAIASVTVLTGGTVSPDSQPNLAVTDATGASAVLAAVVQNRATFTANSGVFTTGMVGDVIRANRGIATIISRTNSTTVVVDITQALMNAWPALSGSWSCTEPVTEVSGLSHLEGLTVSILADGGVEPQQTVVDGAVTLTHAASSILVGLPYTSQMQTLDLDAPSNQGTTQGKRKSVAQLTVRMQDTRGLYFGPTFDELVLFKERGHEIMGRPVQPFTGDHVQSMLPAWQEEGRICLQVTDPLPCSILGIIPDLTVGDS